MLMLINNASELNYQKKKKKKKKFCTLNNSPGKLSSSNTVFASKNTGFAVKLDR